MSAMDTASELLALGSSRKMRLSTDLRWTPVLETSGHGELIGCDIMLSSKVAKTKRKFKPRPLAEALCYLCQ